MSDRKRRLRRAAYRWNETDGSWRKDVGDMLFAIEPADERRREWWLTLVCDRDTPRMTFAGSLRECLHVDQKVVKLVREGKL